jgi:hypothetical protein
LGLIIVCFANGLLEACCMIIIGFAAIVSFLSWAKRNDTTDIKTVNAIENRLIIKTSLDLIHNN